MTVAHGFSPDGETYSYFQDLGFLNHGAVYPGNYVFFEGVLAWHFGYDWYPILIARCPKGGWIEVEGVKEP